jgi:iron complex transport system substrate-binding protein
LTRSLLLFLVLWPGSCRSGPEQQASGRVRRVVTTTPSATEIIAAAGGLERIVGVDRFSRFPPEVAGLPVVGDFMAPSVEAILQLEPDLVVLDAVQGRAAEALRAGGQRTLVLEMHTVAHVLDGIARAGDALGTQEVARAERTRLERAIAEVRARGQARPRRPRVLMVVDREVGALRSIVAAGPGTYLDELTSLAGADNVLRASAARYPNVSPETILEARPDVILDAVHTSNPLAAARDWNALRQVPAVDASQIHMIGEPHFISPGPRLDKALEQLEKLLYPD